MEKKPFVEKEPIVEFAFRYGCVPLSNLLFCLRLPNGDLELVYPHEHLFLGGRLQPRALARLCVQREDVLGASGLRAYGAHAMDDVDGEDLAVRGLLLTIAHQQIRPAQNQVPVRPDLLPILHRGLLDGALEEYVRADFAH